MCTVSWVSQDGGYQLFSNRDVARSRLPALPPRRHRADGVDFLAPVDGDHGGAWISVNGHGLTLCLLNGANLTATPTVASSKAEPVSRGLLLVDLAPARSAGEVAERFRAAPLECYQPLTIVILSPGEPAAAMEWNGSAIAAEPIADRLMPLISSSVETETVRDCRHRVFRKEVGVSVTPSALARFHRSHHYGPSPYSPCMHRRDAQTVSLTVVTVTPTLGRMTYFPDSPCQPSKVHSSVLPILKGT